jgi:hypothetical protein
LPPTVARVHPTQLYEALPLFLIGALLIKLRRSRRNDSVVFST